MSGSDKTQYDSLRGTDYVEFWDLREQYEAKIEREIANQRKK